MTTPAQLIETFASLADEMNTREPTAELCRDWAYQLADACGDLSVIVEGIQDVIGRIDSRVVYKDTN